MEHKILKAALFVMVIAILVSSCKKEETGLEGTYNRTMSFDSESIDVDLSFTKDGLLIWAPGENVSGHTSSQVGYEKLPDSGFRIFDDPDCGSEADYTYTINGKTLTITALSDDCEPRVFALSGNWRRK